MNQVWRLSVKTFFYTKKYRWLVFYLAAVLIGCALLFWGARSSSAAVYQKRNYNVYIAFGFHVNLYHSFRSDTNDEDGFGRDIRIIRNTIKTLDRFNAEGIPVKGVWDFDNLFSLQEILPQHAPDIIADIRRRVEKNGDEILLMSFNNGIISAMTADEARMSVRFAITNAWQSGVKDLFGTYTPIVRPQEMMTAPGNFSIYKEFGVQAVALYYSATPFDAFRVFTPPLTREQAHNPVTYRHPQTKEEMVVIPTYHFGDLVEHVSLKNWVEELRDLQLNNKLNNDALIFINYDADSELWGGVEVPWFLQWMPNTGGLGALIEEVRHLANVRFTSLGDYLKDHPPVGSFYFSQDTADGSYNGYNSWAEKAETSSYWTTIERNRGIRNAAVKAIPFFKETKDQAEIRCMAEVNDITRLKALSTTNFGMATPFLARGREQAMKDILDDLNRSSDEIEQFMAAKTQDYLKRQPHPSVSSDLSWIDTVLVLQTHPLMSMKGNRFLTVSPPSGLTEPVDFFIVSSKGEIFPTVTLGAYLDANGRRFFSLCLTKDNRISDGIYHIYCRKADENADGKSIPAVGPNANQLSNGRLEVRFNPAGNIEGIYLDGLRQADSGSLLPYLRYDGKVLPAVPDFKKLYHSTNGRASSLHMGGRWPGPPEGKLSAGWFDYQLTMPKGVAYLFLHGRLVYPSTRSDDILKRGSVELMRRADIRWQETAPAELRFSANAGKQYPPVVLKRNYLDIDTRYRLDYFKLDEHNLDLDNINNHITPAYVGVVMPGPISRGVAVSKDNSISANFAFAPMKMRHHPKFDNFSITVNPFGTYHGKQYYPQTWGNRQGYQATILAGEQFASSAPTYNGKSLRFALMYAFFEGREIPQTVENDLIGYAYQPFLISSGTQNIHRTNPQPYRPVLTPPTGFTAGYDDNRVQFNWNPDNRSISHYRIYCGTRPGRYEQIYPATGSSLTVPYFKDKSDFAKGRRYYACIQAVLGSQRNSTCSAEIQFMAESNTTNGRPDLPVPFGVKILWTNLKSFLNSWLK